MIIKPQTILGNRYQLTQKISQFANRQTWRATDLQAEREIYGQVILKILVCSPQISWEQVKLFER